MQSPPRTDPPYVAIRRSAWPTRRSPRLLYIAAAVLLVIGVSVALVHRPSTGQRASDLRGFLHDMTTGIESCAGGVSESLTALRGIESGSSNQVTDAIGVARDGASNCSLANSMPLDDLASYQVTESLASFHLASAVKGLVTWASPDAVNVQTDVANVLAARTPQARSTATAALQRGPADAECAARVGGRRAAARDHVAFGAGHTAQAARMRSMTSPGCPDEGTISREPCGVAAPRKGEPRCRA